MVRTLTVQQLNELARGDPYVFEAVKRVASKVNEVIAEGSLFTLPLHVNGSNVIFPGNLVTPTFYTLRLLAISAWYQAGTVTGPTTVILNRVFGPFGTLATLELPQLLSIHSIVSKTFDQEIQMSVPLSFTRGTDGGHRDVFATAIFRQT